MADANLEEVRLGVVLFDTTKTLTIQGVYKLLGFKVKKIEFESSSNWEKIPKNGVIGIFMKEAKNYIPKNKPIVKFSPKSKKLTIKFNKEISLNTVYKILSQLKRHYAIELEEIEYECEDKKVEVELK